MSRTQHRTREGFPLLRRYSMNKITVTTLDDTDATYCVMGGRRFVCVDIHPAKIGRAAVMTETGHDWFPIGTVTNIDPTKNTFRVAVPKSDLSWWLESFEDSDE